MVVYRPSIWGEEVLLACRYRAFSLSGATEKNYNVLFYHGSTKLDVIMVDTLEASLY